jgi:hypothetical protein
LNGDLKNQFVETTVGFDTICKVGTTEFNCVVHYLVYCGCICESLLVLSLQISTSCHAIFVVLFNYLFRDF